RHTRCLSDWSSDVCSSDLTLQINYEDVTGIKVHSELRYAGAPAGRVIAMRHLTAKERESSPNKRDAVRVTVSLDDAIPPLPADEIGRARGGEEGRSRWARA